MKRFLWLFIGLLSILGGYYLYSRLSESQKRFIKHIIKQIPEMPFRYQV